MKFAKIVVILLLGLVAGQVRSQTNTNWGVRVVITSSTNSLILKKPYTECFVHSVILNNSSSNISLRFHYEPNFGYDVTLIDKYGKARKTIPFDSSPHMVFLDSPLVILPGSNQIFNMPVRIDESFEPGVYMLRFSRKFYVNDQEHEVASNLVEMEVKPGLTQSNSPAASITNAQK